MFADEDPLWFVSSELLSAVFHAEISAVTQLLAKRPNFRDLFDSPEATIPERSVCFSLLAHRELVSMIDEKFVARYEESPSLNDIESNTVNSTFGLVPGDAPAWVLEMQQVVERLPAYILTALPEPLRIGSYGQANAEQMRAINSTKTTLSTVEQIQGLTDHVLEQQLRRLERRWSAALRAANPESQVTVQGSELSKRKIRRTRDKVRMARDRVIAGIDDAYPIIGEFLRQMDERRVQPQPTWSGWPGSWSQAYKDPRLRKLIHQDKSRALARYRRSQK